MNKLIIIGNGFDLAHKYPTSYGDFISWLIKKELKSLFGINKNGESTGQYGSNPLFKFGLARADLYLKQPDEHIDANIINIIRENLQNNQRINGGNLRIAYNPIKYEYGFKLFPENDFAVSILENICDLKWVDIEQEYFRSLKNILNAPSNDRKRQLTIINDQLQFLCDELKIYLLSLDMRNHICEFESIFNRSLAVSIDDNGGKREKSESGKTCILNFNYTNTVNQYLPENDDRFFVINIHGSIHDIGNPMIIGHGDERDSDFSKLESQEDIEFLKFAKQLWYGKTHNYQNLERFIRSDAYTVQIIGHSCGFSDRTLLGMILEHENCHQIDAFYRIRENGEDSFQDLYSAIFKQFNENNKVSSRSKVSPINVENIIPQYQ